jgi:hypothetical protein
LQGGRALLALQQQLNASEPALNLSDARNYAHRVQDVRCRFLRVIALRNRKNETIAL